ncbi:hypothetical protein [Paenibacillus sinopodophylli]|uniref:hypothetical protein n=1 Tax=Paenibacillus sinopodophylli TaxID=1837342 RepID=UPI00110CB316|nr:hypothetical protein [Paenibacillus sinopodophylli]
MANLSQVRTISITHCSLVIAPIDIWTRRLPMSSALVVALEGVHKKPIRKPDGTYLFLDLVPGSYVLTVTSSAFIPFKQQIETAELNKLNPVVTVPLLPGSGYAYPSSVTGISFSLCDSSGASCDGASVWAHASEDSTARARLVQDTLAGAETAFIGLLQGQTVAGESLLLRGQGMEELVQVAEVLPGGGLRFVQPLKQSYRRGASLLPAVQTRSAHNGVVILPFRGTLPRSFAVQAYAEIGNCSASAELTARAGEVITAQTLIVQNNKK